MKIRQQLKIFLILIFFYWHIISIVAQISKNCPQSEIILPCRCALKGEEIQIWCSHSNLPQIMDGIKAIERTTPESIDELILENNQLPALPGRFFGILKISRLMLRHNSIERVSNGWLNELENHLIEIFIVEPNLRSIPTESLNGFHKLEAITIQSQQLKRLPDFSGLINLKYLSVLSKSLMELPSYNLKQLPKLQNIHFNGGENLYRLDAGLFDNLISLKTIDLSHNGITGIHLRTLSRLPNLISLKLSYNHINDLIMIGRSIKDLENLQKLRLDNNLIRILTEGSFIDLPLLTELYLNDNHITEIQYGSFHRIPNLKVIYLQNNHIRQIHPEFFLMNSGRSVESLYLYNNQIERIEELKSILDALPGLKFLDLTQNLLIEIPFGALHGHGTIEQLHLNDNLIRLIERDALMAMPALRELRLRNNSLSDNLIMPFWNLPGLKGLDLAQNQFRRINSILLTGLPSLRRLDLSQNLLNFIDPTTFIHTPMMETLNISFNEIHTIHSAIFRNLDRLFEIDITDNQLDEIIPGLPKIIERLSMRGNMITSLPSITKSLNLPNLRMLDMSQNIIEYIPKYTLQSLNQLRVLSFAQNHLRSIEDQTFLGADSLELLHLQSNQINDINELSLQTMKNLRDLNLQNNKIELIANNLFLNNTNLEQLDLSRNSIKELPPLVFKNLRNLQFLDLSNNILTALPESLANLIALKDIDLSFNHLKYLPAIIIDSWKNVLEIRLSNNQINELKQGTIRNLPKLQYLDLSSNEINSIEPRALKNLPDLQELVLADNKLIELKDHVFENLQNLQAAHLQHNSLRYISPESFFQSPSIIYLNLSANNFGNMENIGLRSSMRSLEVLDVSSNIIRTVKTMPLKVLNWLVELNMDNNQICKINGSPFETMPRLRVLSIRNNRLKTMPERTFRNLRGNIAILDIDGNPIRCSCEMNWLSVWLDETNSPNPGPKCQNGKLLRTSRFEKNECESDLRASNNQLPLFNEHGDLFARQITDEFNDECELDQLENNKQRPLPHESEYFYDQYIDYPLNDTHESINDNNLTDSNNNQIQLTSSATISPSNIAVTGQHHNLNSQNSIDLNNTLLNYNLYNRPSQSPAVVQHNSSPFTFFGYPLPSLGFGRYLGPSAARKSDNNKIENLNRNKIRMFRPSTVSDYEKYLNQNNQQYHDISARNRYIETTSNENLNSNEQDQQQQNTFKTSFKNPLPERGGFLPIMPSHIGGFIPVNPYRNNTIPTISTIPQRIENFSNSNPNSSNNNNDEEYDENDKYTEKIPMIPLITIEPETYKKSKEYTSSRKSNFKENFLSLSGVTDQIESIQQHSYSVTEDNEEIYQTTTIITPQLDQQSIEDTTIIPINDDIFPPTSTSETILLIPPSDGEEQFLRAKGSWPINQQQQQQITDNDNNNNNENENSVEKLHENPKIISQTRPSGGRSRIIKVFTPQSLLNLPTAEEYFRTTTINPINNLDNEYQSNEFVTATYYQTEEPPSIIPTKSGMDWYYNSYKKNQNWKIQLDNEIETVRPIRKNNCEKLYKKFNKILIFLIIYYCWI